MGTGSDPRQIIDDAPLSRLQIIAIAIAVGLNALDGFDVLSISFAAPGIAKEWNIDKAALGVVLSMELIGMAVGSVLFGGIADRIGRRRTILTCLVVMAFGMLMVPGAANVFHLSFWRVLTGLGIGGMLAATAAITAEFANRKRRNLALAIMTIGYPIGAVVGGIISTFLLAHFDWRSVFIFGGCATLCFLPLVLFFVPEPMQFLLVHRDAGTLDRVNGLMRRLGHAPVTELPAVTQAEEKASIADILKPGLIATTLLVTAAYFLHIVTFYFVLKWAPKIVVDMGFAPASAAGVLVWANIGGAVGGGIFGFLTQRYSLKGMTIGVLLLSFGMVTIFGAAGATTLVGLSLLAFAVGLFTNSGVVGLYTIFAHAFPTHVRGTGTGFAIGIGRGGAALSPILAGVLFQAGLSLAVVAAILGCGSLLAMLALAGLKLGGGDGRQQAAHG